jgi:nucleoside phosphorylase
LRGPGIQPACQFQPHGRHPCPAGRNAPHRRDVGFRARTHAVAQPPANPVRHRINGIDFTTGTLQGKPVVLFLSGISMVNASMNTQLALDRFNITHIVFSGIAGGVNPALHIGDVSRARQWGQYLEVLMARETAPGQFTIPPRMEAQTLRALRHVAPSPGRNPHRRQPKAGAQILV